MWAWTTPRAVCGAPPRRRPRARARRAAGRGRGASAPQDRAVAVEQLRLLAQVLAHEPQQIVDDALLAAGRAVAVVQEEDHEQGKASLGRRSCRPVPRSSSPRATAPGYLDVALRSIAPQAAAARRRAARRRRRPGARDAAVAAAPRRALRRPRPAARAQRRAQHRRSPRRPPSCSCFVDDDVEVRPGWLARAARRRRERPRTSACFTGPIRARFEDHRLRICGREGPPITSLDLGPADTRRRPRLGREHDDPPQRDRAGRPVRRARELYGDEQEWQARCARPAGGSATSPPPRSTTGARATTRACARWPAPPPAAAGPARRYDVVERHGAVARRASCASSPAAPLHGPRFAARTGPS